MPQALSAKSKQLTVFRLMAAYQFRNQIRRDDAESNSVPTKAERGVASWVLGRLADISKPDKTKVRQETCRTYLVTVDACPRTQRDRSNQNQLIVACSSAWELGCMHPELRVLPASMSASAGGFVFPNWRGYRVRHPAMLHPNR